MSTNIEAAIEEASVWTEVDGIEFVGQGEEEGVDCILVGVSRPVEEIRSRLPKSLHGFRVVVQSSGILQAE